MKLSELDFWRLHDAMNIAQAAALITGNYPSNIRSNDYGPYLAQYEGEPSFDHEERNGQFDAALSALTTAVKRGRLAAQTAYKGEFRAVNYVGGEPEGYWDGDIDQSGTTIDVLDLMNWLESKNIRPVFFFPAATHDPDYLDPKNPRYAPKLAAAVRAWQSVTDAGGRHPKQALMRWLREHAAVFGLIDDEGRPNETGVEEVAKVANWKPGGGAPRTPSK